MRTDELIKAMAADAAGKPMPMNPLWLLAFVMAVIVAALTFFAMLGPRSDLAAAVETIRFPFKFVVTVLLASTAWALARAMARPEGARTSAKLALVAAPALLLAAVFVEMLVVPPSEWSNRLIGRNAMVCLVSIPMIGLGPLIAFLAVLRHGAPTQPARAGAVAGILAGALAATFYAAHCTDDSPLFVGVWYTLAIALLAIAGAIAGKLLVRW